MPISTTPINVNRKTSGLVLPPDVSNEIWANAVEESAVMQLARRIDLPGSGLSIPVITGEPVADFVAESTEKPVSRATFETKTMTPYKISVIELFSDEFRRDMAALYDELVRRAPAAIGAKFDETVFFGNAPGTGFDTLAEATEVSIAPAEERTTYDGLMVVVSDLAAANASIDGFALSPLGQATLLAATDNVGRPLFIDSVVNDGAIGRVLGARVVKSQSAYDQTNSVVGFAGDWSKARYGIVDGINIDFSDQATIDDGTNQVNLWQRNMFAVRIEAEVGFVVRGTDYFRKLTAE